MYVQEVARKLFTGEPRYQNLAVDQEVRIRGAFSIHQKMVGRLKTVMEQVISEFLQVIGSKTIVFIPRDTDLLSVQICPSHPNEPYANRQYIQQKQNLGLTRNIQSSLGTEISRTRFFSSSYNAKTRTIC